MASKVVKGTRGIFTKETPHDRFWFENFNNGVLVVGAHLEIRAYEYMTGKGRVGYHTCKYMVVTNPLARHLRVR